MRIPRLREIRVEFFFAWYDLWMGFYWSRKERALYFLPVPTIGLRIRFGCDDSLWKALEKVAGPPDTEEGA